MSSIISFFQKITKGGVGIRAGGGLENFSKINKRGNDYSVLESIIVVRMLGVQGNGQQDSNPFEHSTSPSPTEYFNSIQLALCSRLTVQYYHYY